MGGKGNSWILPKIIEWNFETNDKLVTWEKIIKCTEGESEKLEQLQRKAAKITHLMRRNRHVYLRTNTAEDDYDLIFQI